MGFENYISESEAAVVAGVGVSTLRRFAEAGYFTIETENDGLRLYPRSQIEKVFGLARHDPAKEIPPMAVAEEWDEGKREASVAISSVTASVAPSLTASPSPASEPPKVATAENQSSEKPSQKVDIVAAELRPANETDHQIHRSKAITEMQERLLLIREEEIRSLKEEREWLRARIEKLEEKGNRDQLLLLAETQTIKALITIQEQRRSPFRSALEWLGFIAPTTTGLSALPLSPASIEVKEEKKS